MPQGFRSISEIGISLFESGEVLRPSSIARHIVNMAPTEEGTLRRIRGPVLYEPHHGVSIGPIFGIGSSESLGGANHVMVFRAGSTLYVHEGWNTGITALSTGLSYDVMQPYMDAVTTIDGKIIWCNGMDRPLVVDAGRNYGRLATPLGFDRAPAAPTAYGPASGGLTKGTTAAAIGTMPSNYRGYSHLGKVGSVSTFNGEDGALLDGAWHYYMVWEDLWGNLSPASTPSNDVSIKAQSVGYTNAYDTGNYTRMNKLEMLLRQFYVTGADVGDSHVQAMHLYRTQDVLHTEGRAYRVARVDGRQSFMYPDSQSDGTIGQSSEMLELVPVPTYRVSCEYQGRLVIGNFKANPGMVRWSDPMFIGQFGRDSWAIPDAGGEQISGLVSHAGRIIAMTPTSIFAITLDPDPSISPLSRTIGCVSPTSIQSMRDGSLVWLGQGTFYKLNGDTIEEIGTPIREYLTRVNWALASRASSAVDPSTGEYMCAVPTSPTSLWNDKMYCYSLDMGWRERTYGSRSFEAMANEAGHARHVLAGMFLAGSSHDLYVVNAEGANASLSDSAVYETVELRMDTDAHQQMHVREIHIGFVESDGADATDLVDHCTIRVWRTQRTAGEYVEDTIDLIGNDLATTSAMGKATLGSDTYRDPICLWRKIGVSIQTTGLRFRITFSRDLHLHGIKIVADPLGQEGSRVPGRRS